MSVRAHFQAKVQAETRSSLGSPGVVQQASGKIPEGETEDPNADSKSSVNEIASARKATGTASAQGGDTCSLRSDRRCSLGCDVGYGSASRDESAAVHSAAQNRWSLPQGRE